MTVRELIQRLSEVDQDKEVFYEYDGMKEFVDEIKEGIDYVEII